MNHRLTGAGLTMPEYLPITAKIFRNGTRVLTILLFTPRVVIVNGKIHRFHRRINLIVRHNLLITSVSTCVLRPLYRATL